jgi:hypothetical protein
MSMVSPRRLYEPVGSDYRYFTFAAYRLEAKDLILIAED